MVKTTEHGELIIVYCIRTLGDARCENGVLLWW